MAQLYLRGDTGVRHSPSAAVRPGDLPFIVAANIAAGWLYEIAGPFFWAALVVMLALGGVAPR